MNSEFVTCFEFVLECFENLIDFTIGLWSPNNRNINKQWSKQICLRKERYICSVYQLFEFFKYESEEVRGQFIIFKASICG